MKIEFKIQLSYRNGIIFIFPGNPNNYWLGAGEFTNDGTSYPTRLYRCHDWVLKLN